MNNGSHISIRRGRILRDTSREEVRSGDGTLRLSEFFAIGIGAYMSLAASAYPAIAGCRKVFGKVGM